MNKKEQKQIGFTLDEIRKYYLPAAKVAKPSFFDILKYSFKEGWIQNWEAARGRIEDFTGRIEKVIPPAAKAYGKQLGLTDEDIQAAYIYHKAFLEMQDAASWALLDPDIAEELQDYDLGELVSDIARLRLKVPLTFAANVLGMNAQTVAGVLLTTGATAAVTGPAAPAVGLIGTAVGAYTEASLGDFWKAIEILQKEGVDLYDPADIMRYFSDPERKSSFLKRVRAYGITLGTLTALTGPVGGRLAASVGKKVAREFVEKLAGRAARIVVPTAKVAAHLSATAAEEAVPEFFAQIASGADLREALHQASQEAAGAIATLGLVAPITTLHETMEYLTPQQKEALQQLTKKAADEEGISEEELFRQTLNEVQSVLYYKLSPQQMQKLGEADVISLEAIPENVRPEVEEILNKVPASVRQELLVDAVKRVVERGRQFVVKGEVDGVSVVEDLEKEKLFLLADATERGEKPPVYRRMLVWGEDETGRRGEVVFPETIEPKRAIRLFEEQFGFRPKEIRYEYAPTDLVQEFTLGEKLLPEVNIPHQRLKEEGIAQLKSAASEDVPGVHDIQEEEFINLKKSIVGPLGEDWSLPVIQIETKTTKKGKKTADRPHRVAFVAYRNGRAQFYIAPAPTKQMLAERLEMLRQNGMEVYPLWVELAPNDELASKAYQKLKKDERIAKRYSPKELLNELPRAWQIRTATKEVRAAINETHRKIVEAIQKMNVARYRQEPRIHRGTKEVPDYEYLARQNSDALLNQPPLSVDDATTALPQWSIDSYVTHDIPQYNFFYDSMQEPSVVPVWKLRKGDTIYVAGTPVHVAGFTQDGMAVLDGGDKYGVVVVPQNALLGGRYAGPHTIASEVVPANVLESVEAAKDALRKRAAGPAVFFYLPENHTKLGGFTAPMQKSNRATMVVFVDNKAEPEKVAQVALHEWMHVVLRDPQAQRLIKAFVNKYAKYIEPTVQRLIKRGYVPPAGRAEDPEYLRMLGEEVIVDLASSMSDKEWRKSVERIRKFMESKTGEKISLAEAARYIIESLSTSRRSIEQVAQSLGLQFDLEEQRDAELRRMVTSVFWGEVLDKPNPALTSGTTKAIYADIQAQINPEEAEEEALRDIVEGRVPEAQIPPKLIQWLQGEVDIRKRWNLHNIHERLIILRSQFKAAIFQHVEALKRELERCFFEQHPEYARYPAWLRRFISKRRLRKFQNDLIYYTRYLNAVASHDGEFVFETFKQRAGLLTDEEIEEADLEVSPGDTVRRRAYKPWLKKDGLDPWVEEDLYVGERVELPDGRKGYQLWRVVDHETQAQIYNILCDLYPEFKWIVDMYIDPALTGARVRVGNVEIPVFNRFASATAYAEGHPEFKALAGYTPDVVVTQTLFGAVKRYFTGVIARLRAGTRSLGRRYKTGTAAEEANLVNLLDAHAIRTAQLIQEDFREQWMRAVLSVAKPIPGNDISRVPEGWVPVDVAIASLHKGLQKFQQIMKRYLRTRDYLVEDPEDIKEGKRFLEKFQKIAYAMRRSANLQALMIPKELADTLTVGYGYSPVFLTTARIASMAANIAGLASPTFFKMLLSARAAARWLVNNTKACLLLHPRTYLINYLDNYLQQLVLGVKEFIRGVLKRDLRYSFYVSWAMYRNFLLALPVFRQIVGLGAQQFLRRYERAIRTWLPEEVFALQNIVVASDLYKLGLQEEVKTLYNQGRIKEALSLALKNPGPMILALIGYSNIDVKAKQRLVVAWLEAKARVDGRARGLYGRDLHEYVENYIANPPIEDIQKAVDLANRWLLNYQNVPGWVKKMSRSASGQLTVFFPTFKYSWIRREIGLAFRGPVETLRHVIKWARGKEITEMDKEEFRDAVSDTLAIAISPVIYRHLFRFASMGLGYAIRSLFYLPPPDDPDDNEEDDPRFWVGSTRRVVPVFDPRLGFIGWNTRFLPRQYSTVNRINISKWLRDFISPALADSATDYWFYYKGMPVIQSAAVFYQAYKDATLYGFERGIKTFFEAQANLINDIINLGPMVRVPLKILQPLLGDRYYSFIDPWGVNVPITAYITKEALNLIPGVRQADTLLLFLDPYPRRLAASRMLSYYPGVKEALKQTGWTAVLDRLINGRPPFEEMPPQGPISRKFKIVIYPRRYEQWQLLLGLLGINLRPIERIGYESLIRQSTAYAKAFRKALREEEEVSPAAIAEE